MDEYTINKIVSDVTNELKAGYWGVYHILEYKNGYAIFMDTGKGYQKKVSGVFKSRQNAFKAMTHMR